MSSRIKATRRRGVALSCLELLKPRISRCGTAPRFRQLLREAILNVGDETPGDLIAIFEIDHSERFEVSVNDISSV
jgi:hypothetical protein